MVSRETWAQASKGAPVGAPVLSTDGGRALVRLTPSVPRRAPTFLPLPSVRVLRETPLVRSSGVTRLQALYAFMWTGSGLPAPVA